MLLMDLGNSRAKIASLHETQAFVSIENNELSVAAIQDQFTFGNHTKKITICSVRDRAFNDDFVAELKAQNYSVSLLSWRDVSPWLKTDYKTRQSLGLDRQIALLGAMSMTADAALVLDLGTASTIDALGANGEHLGGVIFPGVEIQRSALLAGTDDIVVENTVQESQAFPLSTADAVFSGTLQAWRGGVWAIHAKMLSEMSGPVQTYITGGQARLLESPNNDSILSVPDLVLRGIEYLLEKTQ